VAKIHQKERKIVEHIAGRKPLVEFQRIKQHRLPVNQQQIAQMQIAVHPFDMTKRRAFPQDRRQGGQVFSRPVQKCPDQPGTDNPIKRGQHTPQFVKNIADQMVTLILPHRTTRMKPLDGRSQRLCHGIGQPTAGGNRRHLTIGGKPMHPQGPFHRPPGTVEVKPPIGGPRHRHHITVDHRGGWAI
jgi:hypothetical protein